MLSPKLPFTSKSAAVRILQHALSLDKRCTKFAPTFYANLVPGEVDATAFVQRSDSKEVWFVGHHSGMSFTNIWYGQMHRTLNFGWATRKHHAAVHDGTCYMSEPCRLHDFQHIRHAF